jgi:predicted nucleic acid-binding protein
VADGSGTPIVVLDTPVVVKWFLHEREAYRSEALALRDAHVDGRVGLAVPALLLCEVANVLRYTPDWDAARVQRAIRSLGAMQLDIVAVSFRSLERAVALAYDCHEAVCDTTFVALAESLGAEFITADERLRQRLSSSPLPIRWNRRPRSRYWLVRPERPLTDRPPHHAPSSDTH